MDNTRFDWEERLSNILYAWSNPDDRQYLTNELRPLISNLLAERDKEWLSCLPERDDYGEGLDGCKGAIAEGFNKYHDEFLENAKAKNLI